MVRGAYLRCTTEFQFTHPGGVRQGAGCRASPLLMFQFTHPGGVRLVPDSDYSAVGMFQFTHPGGVRPPRLVALVWSELLFQFTHPGGVRPPW